MKKGFDNKKYLKLQSENIKKRIEKFDKLYIEFGGKLLDDYHAVRCLPGFEYDSKLRMLKELKKDLEIIICINANDIERHKIRADYGITYDTCRDSKTLREELERVLHGPKPCICQVFVTKQQKTEPKLASRQLQDGTMVSASLEDMYPFLPREELEENMKEM